MVESCGLSEVLDAFSASGSKREGESAEGGAGESAVAFQPLRNDAIAATKPKSEIQAFEGIVKKT